MPTVGTRHAHSAHTYIYDVTQSYKRIKNKHIELSQVTFNSSTQETKVGFRQLGLHSKLQASPSEALSQEKRKRKTKQLLKSIYF